MTQDQIMMGIHNAWLDRQNKVCALTFHKQHQSDKVMIERLKRLAEDSKIIGG